MVEYRYLLSKCLTYQHASKSNETVFYPKILLLLDGRSVSRSIYTYNIIYIY